MINTKKYTYRTDAEVNEALNVLGVETNYTVLIAGVTRAFSNTFTKFGAQMEVDAHARVFGYAGMVINVKTGEIVYTNAGAAA